MRNPEVAGSNPSCSSNNTPYRHGLLHGFVLIGKNKLAKSPSLFEGNTGERLQSGMNQTAGALL
jgi:hypothetical protein